MKKEYTTPSIEIVLLSEEDIITTSNELDPMPIGDW